jgi:hypothetical protein
MVEKELYKNIISTLGKNAFENFCSIALETENQDMISFDKVNAISHNMFEIKFSNYEHTAAYHGKLAYFINYLPIHLLSRHNFKEIDFSNIAKSIADYMVLEHKNVGYFSCGDFTLINMGIITNISNMAEAYFFETIAPLYKKAFKEKGVKPKPFFNLQLGTIDSMLDNMSVKQVEEKVHRFF